jgi:hypothetical protein
MMGHRLTRSLQKTARTCVNLLPIIVGILLLRPFEELPERFASVT